MMAADFFSNFSISLKDDVWHQASGAFWASRAYSKLNKYEDINFWLNRASKNPNSFYGILSSTILGVERPINWEKSILVDSDEINLFSLPSGKRIKALIQVGLSGELEDEIIFINTILNKNVAIKSLEIAQHFNLAHTQLKIANTLQRYGIQLPTKFFYPTPLWKPRNGFKGRT